jgi:SAM-dependent methyltransferase
LTENPHWARDDSGVPDPRHVRAARLISVVPDGKLRRTLLRRYRIAHHKGDAVECPVCGSTFSQFMWGWNRAGAICWSCGAAERHRALWLYLQNKRPLENAKDVLHFSAEYPLAVRLREQIGPGYRTSEFEPGKADLAIDITAIDLPPESLDAIICSHVLEHVPDDALAMRELHRVLRPGGTAIVMVPLDHSRATTYEDPSITDPEERREKFWQHDHVRLYAPDIADRLRAAGFEVTSTSPAETAGPELTRRYALRQEDVVFTCVRVAGSSSSSGS